MYQIGALPVATIYEEAKIWVFIATTALSLYKCFSWVVKLRTDLSDVKDAVHSQTTEFRIYVEKQTNAIVGELKELRADLRVLRPEPVQHMRLAKAARQR